MKKFILLAGASSALILSFLASVRLKNKRATMFTEADGYVGMVTDEGGIELVDAAVKEGSGPQSEVRSNRGGLTGQQVFAD